MYIVSRVRRRIKAFVRPSVWRCLYFVELVCLYFVELTRVSLELSFMGEKLQNASYPAAGVATKYRNTFTCNQTKLPRRCDVFIKQRNTFTSNQTKFLKEPDDFRFLQGMTECHTWIFATNINDLIKRRFLALL